MGRDYYIYAWTYSDKSNLGMPFYIGQGKYMKGLLERTRCARAYAIHNRISSANNRVLAFCQLKANKLKSEGTPHVVEILLHDLTKNEADKHEIELIRKFGRKINNTGILYNVSEGGDMNPMHDAGIREIHSISMRNIDRSKQSETVKNIMNTPEMKKRLSNATYDNMNNPIYKKEWLKVFNSPENIEKLREIQSKMRGVRIEYNGVTYRSKKELARHLNISSQLLNYRIRNNIPIDASVDKGNVFNKKGARLSKFIDSSHNKCCVCGEIKHKSFFSRNSYSSTGVRSSCKKCESIKRVTLNEK